jgi:hypothetical protein
MTTENFCFYSQNRLIQTSQTGGQWYSDTSPISISLECKIIVSRFLNTVSGHFKHVTAIYLLLIIVKLSNRKK